MGELDLDVDLNVWVMLTLATVVATARRLCQACMPVHREEIFLLRKFPQTV